MTNCPCLPWIKGFLKSGTFSAKITKSWETWDVSNCSVKAHGGKELDVFKKPKETNRAVSLGYDMEKVRVEASRGQILRGLGHHAKSFAPPKDSVKATKGFYTVT